MFKNKIKLNENYNEDDLRKKIDILIEENIELRRMVNRPRITKKEYKKYNDELKKQLSGQIRINIELQKKLNEIETSDDEQEQPKKIEKIDQNYKGYDYFAEIDCPNSNIGLIRLKLNEVIDKLNKMEN